MEEKKDLVKAETKDIVDFTSEVGFTGFEGIDNDAGSFAIPFLKIAQASSAEVDPEDPAYIEGIELGQFFNSVTGEIIGRTADLIIVYTERVFNEYKPNRGGFVCTHDRVEGEKLIRDKKEYPYISKESENELVETQTVIVLIANDIESGPLVWPISSTSLKHIKSFFSKIKMLKLPNGSQAPIFSSIFSFETKRKENDAGKKYYRIDKNAIIRKGTINAEQLTAVKSAYELFKKEGVDYSKEENDKQQNFDFEDKPF